MKFIAGFYPINMFFADFAPNLGPIMRLSLSVISYRKLSKPHYKNAASCMELCFGLVAIADVSVKTEVFHVVQPLKLGFWHAATETGMCMRQTCPRPVLPPRHSVCNRATAKLCCSFHAKEDKVQCNRIKLI